MIETTAMVQYHHILTQTINFPTVLILNFGTAIFLINEIVVLAKNNPTKPRRHLFNNGHQVCSMVGPVLSESTT